MPINIPVYSICLPILPFAHPHGQRTHLCSCLPAQHKPSPGTYSSHLHDHPSLATHCSQFSLLSCRSARKRLDARASSSRCSSCRCNSRMAERMRRRSARSAVTSNCGAGGGEGQIILAARGGGRAPAAHSLAWATMSGLSPLSLPHVCHEPALPPTQGLRETWLMEPELLDSLLCTMVHRVGSQQLLICTRCQARHSFLRLNSCHSESFIKFPRAREYCRKKEATLQGPNSVPGEGRVIRADGVHPVSKEDSHVLVPKHYSLAGGGSLIHTGLMGKLRQGQVLRSPSLLLGWGLFFPACTGPALSTIKGAKAQSRKVSPSDNRAAVESTQGPREGINEGQVLPPAS